MYIFVICIYIYMYIYIYICICPGPGHSWTRSRGRENPAVPATCGLHRQTERQGRWVTSTCAPKKVQKKYDSCDSCGSCGWNILRHLKICDSWCLFNIFNRCIYTFSCRQENGKVLSSDSNGQAWHCLETIASGLGSAVHSKAWSSDWSATPAMATSRIKST